MNNLKHGFGIFTFEDGTTYEGPFENDRMVNRNLAGVTSIDQDVAPPTKKGKKDKDKAGKFVASSRVKKEVEQNPFKTLIDISDLLEMEENSKAVEKEVQNILLRHNSELKKWY